MLIDTHTHTWGPDTKELPWKGALDSEHPFHDKPYTHHDHIYHMNEFGIDKSVVVNMSPVYGDGPRGNEYTMRSIEAHPSRLYGVGSVCYAIDGEVLDKETLRDNVRRVIGNDQMLGVRMLAYREYNNFDIAADKTSEWILNKNLNPVFNVLRKHEKCMYILPKPQQLSLVEKLINKHPDVDFVIDHMAWPEPMKNSSSTEGPWSTLRKISQSKNVHVKISSMAHSSKKGWPFTDLYPYVKQLIEWFGPERLLFGSDYPYNAKWNATYGDCISWFDRADFLSKRDKEYIGYQTFLNLHDI